VAGGNKEWRQWTWPHIFSRKAFISSRSPTVKKCEDMIQDTNVSDSKTDGRTDTDTARRHSDMTGRERDGVVIWDSSWDRDQSVTDRGCVSVRLQSCRSAAAGPTWDERWHVLEASRLHDIDLLRQLNDDDNEPLRFDRPLSLKPCSPPARCPGTCFRLPLAACLTGRIATWQTWRSFSGLSCR